MLNQIRGNSYCHIFAFVEEYIVPMVIDHARADVYGDETRLWSLLRFAEEEVKHQEMMRRAVEQFQAGFGVELRPGPGREDVAKVVLDASPADCAAAHEHDRMVHPTALHRARPGPRRAR